MSATLTLDGELAVFTAHELKGHLLAALEGTTALALDLSGVTEVDAAGLQLLLATKREAAERGIDLALQGHSDAVREVLGLTGLDLQLGAGMTASTEAAR